MRLLAGDVPAARALRMACEDLKEVQTNCYCLLSLSGDIQALCPALNR
jgi:hypothetical protein